MKCKVRHFVITDNFSFKLGARLKTTEEGTNLSMLGDHSTTGSQQYDPGTKGKLGFEIISTGNTWSKTHSCLTRHNKAVSEYHIQLQLSLLEKKELKLQ